jgi:hypothetical protein
LDVVGDPACGLYERDGEVRLDLVHIHVSDPPRLEQLRFLAIFAEFICLRRSSGEHQ